MVLVNVYELGGKIAEYVTVSRVPCVGEFIQIKNILWEVHSVTHEIDRETDGPVASIRVARP